MSFQVLADVSEIEDDRPLSAEVPSTGSGRDHDGLSVAIVLHQGEFFAIEDECSHGKVPLSEGEVANGTIECYLHGSVFDLNTGMPLCLPATEPVRVFPCRINGTSIEVDVENPINASAFTKES